MPQYNFSISVPANSSVTPLNTWQYRFPPKSALISLILNAAATGVVMNLTTGAESIVQADSVVSSGGTAGVLPSSFAQNPIVDQVDAGEEIVLTCRNTTAGAIVVNGVIEMTYKQ